MMPLEDTVIQFTFAVNEPSLDDGERQKLAKRLLQQLRNLDEVEKVDRCEDLNPEVGSKPGFATLVGVLVAEVNVKNFKAFLSFLGDRLGDKPIAINIKVGDKEVKIEARSRKELMEAEQIAQALLSKMGGITNE
jgi:hypothetical protein